MDQLAQVVSTLAATTSLDLCNVERPGRTKTGYAERAKVYTPVNAAPLPCNWSPLSETRSAGNERPVGDKPAGISYYRITDLPSGTDVEIGDRVIVLARDQEPAHTFEIQTIVRKGAGMPVQLNCTLEE